MGEEGKSDDDQDSIHNDENGRDDEEEEEEEEDDYKVPRLQYWYNSSVITKRKDNHMLQIIYYKEGKNDKVKMKTIR